MGELEPYIEEGIELARQGRPRSGEKPVCNGVEAVVAEVTAKLHGSRSSPTSHLVHYTGADVVFAMLNDRNDRNDRNGRNGRNDGNDRARDGNDEVDDGYKDIGGDYEAKDEDGEELGGLRLYDTVHANDPEEGRFLLLHWPGGDDGPPWMWEESENGRKGNGGQLGLKEQVEQGLYPGHAYVLSFVPTTAEERNNDRIVFWREYGREGAGCSLSIPEDKLFNDTKCSLTPYRVRYGQEGVDLLAGELTHLYRDPVYFGRIWP